MGSDDLPVRHDTPELAELARLRAEHATVVRALQEAIRDTTRLTRLFAVLNEAAPLVELLDRVMATLSELFLSDIVVLLGATADAGLVPLAAIGLPAGTEQRTIAQGDGGHAREALSSGRSIVVTEVATDPKVELGLRELDVRTGVWVPVTGDEGTRRGVLILARCRPIPFARSDVDLLQAMAYRVGVFVERAHADETRRVLEAGLSQAQKAESLGRMAAAVAHHFNNTLAVVVTNLDLALEDLPQGHSSHDDLVHAREAAMRAAKTGELMLAYIGQGTGDRENLEFGQLVADAVAKVKPTIPSNVQVISEFSTSRLPVLASPPRIAQMLDHLVTNACEAIGARPGVLRIALRAVPSAEVRDSNPTSDAHLSEATSYACLEITDSGCGMAPSTIEKVFDPFFTTKFVGRGLGLAVVHGTVRAHGGNIRVQSELNRGTTFRILLPLAAPVVAGESLPPSSPLARRARRSGLALVVEDEAALRRSTKRILARMGFEVLTAADGLEATELFRQRALEFDIVILDLAMPRLDGWGALENIRACRPDVPVILASGYDEMHALRGRQRHPSSVYLQKPYTLVDLREAVDRLLVTTR